MTRAQGAGALVALAAVVAIGVLIAQRGDDGATGAARGRVELVRVGPGETWPFRLGDERWILLVPAGAEESYSIGTFELRREADGLSTGSLARDGSVESLHMSDLDGDGREDLLVVVRSAGSGGYVSLTVLVSSGGRPSALALPEPPPALTAGYGGHDRVSLRGREIVRGFASYVDDSTPRLDRQWSAADLRDRGKLPVKVGADSNSSPSGEDQELIFSLETRAWRRG